MAYKSLYGKIFGVDTVSGQPYVKGSPWGGSTPTAYGFGKTVYVDSGVAAADGGSPDTAVATMLAGNNLCTANQGDTVVLLPGHAENIAAATALTIAGVRYIGLGEGDDRPTITFTTATTAGFTSAVANLYFENIIFVANFLSIVAAFLLSTAKGVKFVNCVFRDTSGVLNFLQLVKSAGAANTVDRLTMIGCKWNGLGTTSVGSAILSANDIDGLTLYDNVFKLARTATAAVVATISAGVLTMLDARRNIAISQATADTGGGFINVGGTTSTGVVKDNLLGNLSTTDLFMTTSVGLTFDNNKKTGVISTSGYLLPAADS